MRARRWPRQRGRSISPNRRCGLWVCDAEREARRTGALSNGERRELEQLRRENRTLRMERDILEKAAAFFARDHA